jgi:hypothetical protein
VRLAISAPAPEHDRRSRAGADAVFHDVDAIGEHQQGPVPRVVIRNAIGRAAQPPAQALRRLRGVEHRCAARRGRRRAVLADPGDAALRSQLAVSPRSQKKQAPRAMLNGTTTRSPGRSEVTAPPTSSTTPVNS